MNALLFAGLLGGFGGAIRATVGLLKSIKRKRRVRWDYWFITCALAIIIGVFVGMLLGYDYRISMLAGYAGTDLLEGLYKNFNKGKGFVVIK
jgi:Ni,Fe-hydrogenase I cytochrome b subunit